MLCNDRLLSLAIATALWLLAGQVGFGQETPNARQASRGSHAR